MISHWPAFLLLAWSGPAWKSQAFRPVRLCATTVFDMSQETVIPKKRRGPLPTGKGEPIVVRTQPDLMAALDAWIARQPEPKPSRPEAVRRLVALGLKAPA